MTHREPNREPEPPETERWRTTALHPGGKGYGDEDPDLALSEVSKGHRSPASAQRREGGTIVAASGPEPAPENRTHATMATSVQLEAGTPTAASSLPSSGE